MTYLILILGLVTLIVGGEFLVKGAVGIAKKLTHFYPRYRDDGHIIRNFSS